MKTLQKNPVESAKAMSIKLAAINRYPLAYVMHCMMQMLIPIVGTVCTAYAWKLVQVLW